MYLFTDTLLLPLLKLLQPKTIVEIGCEDGYNTVQLLDFCAENGATLHAVDPYPRFTVEAWKQHYGDTFQFYRTTSLNALPSIPGADAMLIDGDHNWYTVYHELKLVEQQTKQHHHACPLIFFHDISWPYARRDMYYNPEAIPEEFRQPYTDKGILPDVPGMVEKDGMNCHLFNAEQEFGPRNGVLTAIEDFLRESDDYDTLIRIPGFHGLGILVPKAISQAPADHPHAALAQMLSAFKLPAPLQEHFERLERSWLDATIQNAIMSYERQVSEGAVAEQPSAGV